MLVVVSSVKKGILSVECHFKPHFLKQWFGRITRQFLESPERDLENVYVCSNELVPSGFSVSQGLGVAGMQLPGLRFDRETGR